MVAALHKNVLHFLNVLHRSRRAMGVEEFARHDASLPDARTLYRWQEQLAKDLLYYPSVTFGSLGLAHHHLFIDNPTAVWQGFPYAIHAEWVVGRPSEQTLYLHCLVPRVHERDFDAVLKRLEGVAATHITSITTHDGCQVMQDSPDDLPLRTTDQDVWDIVERLPLLIPVIFETIEQRHSLPAIWSSVYERLQKRTWEYLPRFARRLPTNGKTYVRECFALLNHTGLFRQNIVRYQPLNALGTPMFLHVQGAQLRTIINAFAQHAPVIDAYPIGDDGALLRLVSTHAVTQHVFSTAGPLPRITNWHFVDVPRNTAEPVPARFAYELLFDPTTTEWVFPHQAFTAIFEVPHEARERTGSAHRRSQRRQRDSAETPTQTH
jgi:hypothetical protein